MPATFTETNFPAETTSRAAAAASIAAAVRDFIQANWNATLRSHTQDEGTLLGLPHPYTVPCRRAMFQELYYWDTYFTAFGLVGSPDTLPLAENNLRNFVHEIERHGFIPNGNRSYYLNRSQPPYFAPFVILLRKHGSFERPGGLDISTVLRALRAEHAFWTTRRATPAGTPAAGLSRYGHQADPDYVMQFFREIKDRAGLPGGDEAACREQSGHMLAECESGWDFTPRFDKRCEHHCPVDLNSNLYVLETTLAELTAASDDPAARTESTTWRIRADARRHLVHALNWDAGQGMFFDYDFVNQRRSSVLSAATLHPLWAGLATEQQAASVVARALPQLERTHGLTACAPCAPVDSLPPPSLASSSIQQSPFSNPHSYQWDHPNLWPCLQTIAWRGLQRYGYHVEARRLAEKYADTVCRSFSDTGDLWEKYNADTGTHHASNDNSYEAPAMMGWTAGVFLDALAVLEK
ncbi:trehalase family glycosidase [Geminisphaera colitermitum]|uniref:trehalase family glycosidase n=1 Tax=Geminisphaera colitermitum TaxID=1148786 RepID=UPI000158D342|nr:trehalase family glycosidase [Geminisphaera colitermitum]